MRKAHPTTDESLIRFGYRFLATVFATYDFDLLRRDSDPDPLDGFLQFEEQDLTEALLALAAIARVSDDEMRTLDDVKAAFPAGVGQFQVGGDYEPLSVREACNKVIHATKVEYDLAWTTENPLWGSWYRAQGLEVTGRWKAPALKLEGKQEPKAVDGARRACTIRDRGRDVGCRALELFGGEVRASPNQALQRTIGLPRFARAADRR